MKFGARNNLKGKVVSVKKGDIMSLVKFKVTKPGQLSSVLTTSAGLVFSGEMSGDLLAFDAANGKELFRYNTGGAMTGGILSYEVGGRQYLAATSGGANNFWQVAPGSATVVIFALP